MSETVDLAVIGAGPAGLAAATVAADHRALRHPARRTAGTGRSDLSEHRKFR